MQTYRATRDGLKVGNTIRNYGDLVPEAADWANKAVWIREGHIEAYAASSAEMDAHKLKFAEKKKSKRVVAKKTAPAKKKRVVRIAKKGNENVPGRQLSERSV